MKNFFDIFFLYKKVFRLTIFFLPKIIVGIQNHIDKRDADDDEVDKEQVIRSVQPCPKVCEERLQTRSNHVLVKRAFFVLPAHIAPIVSEDTTSRGQGRSAATKSTAIDCGPHSTMLLGTLTSQPEHG